MGENSYSHNDHTWHPYPEDAPTNHGYGEAKVVVVDKDGEQRTVRGRVIADIHREKRIVAWRPAEALPQWIAERLEKKRVQKETEYGDD